jgi:hypothetical protein
VRPLDFAPAVAYGVGTGPCSAVFGDFNGDGKLDLAVANSSSNNVSILLGSGNGTFAMAVNYNVGAGPSSVAAGDLNGDGKLDLAVANFASDDVSILLGNGDGTFPPDTRREVLNDPTFVTIGDANGDGKPDLVGLASQYGNGWIVPGNGDGTFATTIFTSFGPGYGRSVAIGDFNRDGTPDLAAALNCAANLPSLCCMSVLLGNGGGSFAPRVKYTSARNPWSVAVGDFNGDGKLDVAVGGYRGEVAIHLGNGDGTFDSYISHQGGTCSDGNCGAGSVAIGEVNGDGIQDLAISNHYSDTLSILLGYGCAARLRLRPLTWSALVPYPSLSGT